MSRMTVMKYLRADTCPMPGPRPNRRSLVDAWTPYLRQRWAEGRRAATGLVREIKALGFPGGRAIVCARLTRWHAEERRPGPYPDAAPVDLAALPPEPPPVRDRSPRRTRWLLLTEPGKRSPDQAAFCDRLLVDCPAVARGVTLALGFRRLVRERDHAGLAPWLAEARGSGVAEFHEFAAGVERDRAAVEAALLLEVSNGQTEGQITKLKLLKRAAYGRASITLLRARLLHAS
jgi:transposase